MMKVRLSVLTILSIIYHSIRNIAEEMEETILEPIVKVKEEEIERKYHEYNEFFAAG